eukprot:scaffold62300_cov54-Attheya_sp.AAC.1
MTIPRAVSCRTKTLVHIRVDGPHHSTFQCTFDRIMPASKNASVAEVTRRMVEDLVGPQNVLPRTAFPVDKSKKRPRRLTLNYGAGWTTQVCLRNDCHGSTVNQGSVSNISNDEFHISLVLHPMEDTTSNHACPGEVNTFVSPGIGLTPGDDLMSLVNACQEPIMVFSIRVNDTCWLPTTTKSSTDQSTLRKRRTIAMTYPPQHYAPPRAVSLFQTTQPQEPTTVKQEACNVECNFPDIDDMFSDMESVFADTDNVSKTDDDGRTTDESTSLDSDNYDADDDKDDEDEPAEEIYLPRQRRGRGDKTLQIMKEIKKRRTMRRSPRLRELEETKTEQEEKFLVDLEGSTLSIRKTSLGEFSMHDLEDSIEPNGSSLINVFQEDEDIVDDLLVCGSSRKRAKRTDSRLVQRSVPADWYGHPPREIFSEGGSLYSRRYLFETGGHASITSFVVGNKEQGCTSLILERLMSQQNPLKTDDLIWFTFTSNMDESPSKAGAMLRASYHSDRPIRVFCSASANSSFGPTTPSYNDNIAKNTTNSSPSRYCYNGLYGVVNIWDESSKPSLQKMVQGDDSFTFLLLRFPGQPSTKNKPDYERNRSLNHLDVHQLRRKNSQSLGLIPSFHIDPKVEMPPF